MALPYSLRKFLHYKIITHNKKWNYKEDNILLRRVIRYGWKHWGIISQGFTNRTSLDCYYRYRYSLKFLIDYSYINQSSIISLTSKEQQQFWKQLSKTNNLKQTLQSRTNSLSLLKQYYIDMQKFSREQQQLLPINYNSVLQISKKINENNSGVTRKPWTKDETERLIYLLSNYASLDNQLLFSCNFRNKGKSIKYNWKLISSTYFPNRTLNNVKDKWHNIQSRIPWTKQEDQIIIDSVKQFGEKDQWDKIALKINSSATDSAISSDSSSLLPVVRSSSQCMTRWRDILKPLQSKQKHFSEFEHLTLIKALREVPLKGNKIDWKSIHQHYVPNRTPLQLYKHYYNVICRPVKWNLQEDKLLLKIIKEYCHQSEAQDNSQGNFPPSLGNNDDVWKRIAQNIPGRTAIQCRNRYIDMLDPSLKRGRYTAEDHFQLFISIKKYGHRWSLVAKEMGRSKTAVAKLYSIWKSHNKFSYSRQRINKGGINSIYGKLLSHI
jgi:hypothetical protein